MLLLRNKKSIKGYGSRTWVPYPPFPLHTHAVHRFRTVMVVFVGSYTVFICSFRPVFTRSVLHFSSCLAHNSTHTHTAIRVRESQGIYSLLLSRTKYTYTCYLFANVSYVSSKPNHILRNGTRYIVSYIDCPSTYLMTRLPPDLPPYRTHL